MERSINPPGLVYEEHDIAGLISTGKMLNENIGDRTKKNLEDAIELGLVVNKLKEVCEHGQYLAALEQICLSHQRAGEFGRIAKVPPAALSTCSSIKEAIRLADMEVAPNERQPKIHCARCARNIRTGQEALKNCPDCKKDRKEAKRAARKARAAQGTGLVDHFKNPIPQGCKNAWSDKFVRKAFSDLLRLSERYRKLHIADGMAKRAKHYPFIDTKEVTDALGFIDNYLDQVVEHLKANRPAGVCPKCKGAKCPECRMSGLVPEKVYLELKEGA